MNNLLIGFSQTNSERLSEKCVYLARCIIFSPSSM